MQIGRRDLAQTKTSLIIENSRLLRACRREKTDTTSRRHLPYNPW